MSVTLPYPSLSAGATISADELNQNFSALANKFGNIDNTDVKSGANISIDKLNASYEYLTVNVSLADGTASNDVLYPLYNDSKGDWTYVSTQWVTDDVGTPTGVIGVRWGSLDGTATDTIPNNWTNATTIDDVALSGTANSSGQGSDATLASSSLAFSGTRCLRFYMSTTDAAAGARIYITATLKRQIKT